MRSLCHWHYRSSPFPSYLTTSFYLIFSFYTIVLIFFFLCVRSTTVIKDNFKIQYLAQEWNRAGIVLKSILMDNEMKLSQNIICKAEVYNPEVYEILQDCIRENETINMCWLWDTAFNREYFLNQNRANRIYIPNSFCFVI